MRLREELEEGGGEDGDESRNADNDAERCRMMMMMMTITVRSTLLLLLLLRVVIMISRITRMLMKRWRVPEGKRKGVSDGPTQNTV